MSGVNPFKINFISCKKKLYLQKLNLNKMKKRGTAMLLCFLLGGLGVHRFYLGETGKGLLYLFTLGLLGLLPFIDLIVWLLGSDESFDQKYNAQAIQRENLKTQKEILEVMKNK